MNKVRRRSKIFFGVNGYGSEETLDAGTKLDKFLLQKGDDITVVSAELRFQNDKENPTAHAILLIYDEKITDEKSSDVEVRVSISSRSTDTVLSNAVPETY